jgi:hypothetical protein
MSSTNNKLLANNVIRIPTSLEGKFFRYWLEFLRPIHKLTNREIEVAELFLKHRYQLSKVVSDEELLDKIVMGEDVKKQIRETLGITLEHFQVIMSKLRKRKVIEDNKLNRKFLPNLIKSENTFSLLLYFEI